MVAMYNHQQWITDTGIGGKPRSSLLKSLDRCVARLSPNNPSINEIKDALVAFNAWADAKLQKGSVGLLPNLQPPANARDANGAFSRLLAQLYLAYLYADPVEFLTNYTLNEAGQSVSSVQTLLAYSEASEQHAGVIAPAPWRNRLRITSVSLANGLAQEPVDVFNVRMIKASEAVNYASIESAYLPTNVEFMTTGKLSGCCFAAYREGSTVFVAHIQPRHNQSGVALKAAIDANGSFDTRSLDGVRTFGVGDYGVAGGGGMGGYAMVIGVRRRDSWELYGQDLGLNTNGPPVKVVRIV
ncbi:hypothetical protein EC912_102188 [Luteibacter rhizovicinus]|uniref:Uncharacterized protein n=1 Tax=Luteibacter rhizovicinus TaxID=242606 RepID=A0A4R3YX13_9GAMM|nr:hypothetical protein [Luteibacter rhizovicinus]TCV95843.1 hypothetical protein EC912_102188 [Luteibacter rhizovicinus]